MWERNGNTWIYDGNEAINVRPVRYFDSRIELDSYAALPPKRLPVDAATHVHKLGVLVAEV